MSICLSVAHDDILVQIAFNPNIFAADCCSIDDTSLTLQNIYIYLLEVETPNSPPDYSLFTIVNKN